MKGIVMARLTPDHGAEAIAKDGFDLESGEAARRGGGGKGRGDAAFRYP